MPAKPNPRNWNDVQTAIATATLVTTLGLWNLFATPAKVETAQVKEPTLPPTEPPVAAEPTIMMPQVKIMFTQIAPQTVVNQQQPTRKKKRNKDNNNGGGGGGGGTITMTKSS